MIAIQHMHGYQRFLRMEQTCKCVPMLLTNNSSSAKENTIHGHDHRHGASIAGGFIIGQNKVMRRQD